MPPRPWLAGLGAALCACLAGLAQARAQDDAKRVCASAFASAQRLMRTGHLLEARKKLVLCGGPECPEIMHPDCQRWLSSVEASLPTLVFQVTSAAGAQIEAVRMSVDGEDGLVLDGRAVSMDPGPHALVFEADGFRATRRQLVVSEGEKLRREVVLLDPLPGSTSSAQAVLPANRPGAASPPVHRPALAPRRLTLPVVAAASGAVLAGVGAVYFGLAARSDDRDLERCSPHCGRDVVDHVKREYLLANLSIGLAVAGATTAAVLFFAQRRASPPSTSRLGLSAGPGRLGLSATGTF
jgi:hypothetical protein